MRWDLCGFHFHITNVYSEMYTLRILPCLFVLSCVVLYSIAVTKILEKSQHTERWVNILVHDFRDFSL